MPVYKDEKRGTWFCKFRYKDYTGTNRETTKRGFQTKREATAWEISFKNKKSGNLGMTVGDFIDLYIEERFPRMKETTRSQRIYIINSKIRPFFEGRPLCDITPRDIMRWQNDLLSFRNPKTGVPYSRSYLKTIHAQLNAMFNYAVKFYDLPNNPTQIAGNIGDDKHVKQDYWTVDEYQKVAYELMVKPHSYYAFEVLYWLGLREGEMLALTKADFDFDKMLVDISKNHQVVHGEHMTLSPKTPHSIRKVAMPDFLAEEMKEFFEQNPELKDGDRLFKKLSKSILYRDLKWAADRAGVKQIRVHDLRHSHVSLLFDMGYNAVSIANRMGHESIYITYNYAHLFPTVQSEMAEALNKVRKEY